MNTSNIIKRMNKKLDLPITDSDEIELSSNKDMYKAYGLTANIKTAIVCAAIVVFGLLLCMFSSLYDYGPLFIISLLTMAVGLLVLVIYVKFDD